jgi:hypothetical protein
MKNKIIVTVFILIFLNLVLSGCLDIFSLDGSITYEAHATSVQYTISYGYNINCSGTGKYRIIYNCDLPEVLNGQVIDIIVHNDDYDDLLIATWNSVKSWNITSYLSKVYDLGITTTVQANSFIVSDLNGENALTIQEINEQYPDLIKQYTKAQTNETTIFIEPNNPNIVNIASQVSNSAGTNNSFLVSKELFRWLKEYTTYETHYNNDKAQTAIYTLQCKTGDCDDLSFLYISLCRSIKIPSRFIRGFLIEKNRAIPHAWVEVFVGGGLGNNGWITVECAGIADSVESEIHQNFGIEDVGHLRLFKDDGSNESLRISLSGLNYKMFNVDRKIDAYFYSKVLNYSIIEKNKLIIDKDNKRSYNSN